MFVQRINNKTNVSSLLKQCRSLASSSGVSNNDISPVLTNRNPRNLEKLRIGYRPDGYHVERKGKCFWHKLTLSKTGRHVTASVLHFQNGEVLKASTQEWAIQKQLFKTTDTSAYVNVGRVLAQRCLESGILEMSCDLEATNEDGKVALFLNAVKEMGVTLEEPPPFKPIRPWDLERPEKPWEVTE